MLYRRKVQSPIYWIAGVPAFLSNGVSDIYPVVQFVQSHKYHLYLFIGLFFLEPKTQGSNPPAAQANTV